jgi:hypothetical protein
MRDRLETSVKDRNLPWSVVIADLEPQAAAAAIKEFCNANVGSPHYALASLANYSVIGFVED